MKQCNESGMGSKKKMHDYFRMSQTEEFIKALKLEPEFTKGNSPYVKSKASRGENAGTWLSPIMFIDFAMWLNPAFKVKVLKFVQDEMIKFRNLAGDAYPTMCKAVSSILPDDIFKQKVRDLAKSLNIIVYGKHESEMRNKVGDESKIRELYELELQIAQWINLGLVTNYGQLKNALQRLYYQKHPVMLPL